MSMPYVAERDIVPLEHRNVSALDLSPYGDNRPQPLILDARMHISGILQVSGEVWLEGRYEADVRSDRIVVRNGATVDGVLSAGVIEIAGTVSGEVYADVIILKPTARVEAELCYDALELEAGSYFEGRSRRHPDPLKLCPKFPALALAAE